MTDDLKTLVPQEVVTGVEVHPFKFIQIPRVMEVLGQYLNVLGSLDDLDLNSVAQMLLLDGGEGIFELILLSTGKDRAWLETLSSDEGVLILAKVIELNFDFFVQRVTPVLEGLSGRLSLRGKPKTGEELSAA